jgi:hypothetical protein
LLRQLTDPMGMDFSFSRYAASSLRTKLRFRLVSQNLSAQYTETCSRCDILWDDMFCRISILLGVLTPNQTYTCPMLSIHTYHQSSKKTAVGYAAAQFSNKKKFDRKLGPVTTSKEEHLFAGETVVMIPVEDVINVYYTSDVNRSVKAQEHSRVVPVVAKKGCFCRCFKKASKPLRQTEIFEQKDAQRIITIHLQYSKYSNLDTVSNARILPESDRAQF